MIKDNFHQSSINRGDSNEYPQHMFLWRKMENYPQNIIPTSVLPKKGKKMVSALNREAEQSARRPVHV